MSRTFILLSVPTIKIWPQKETDEEVAEVTKIGKILKHLNLWIIKCKPPPRAYDPPPEHPEGTVHPTKADDTHHDHKKFDFVAVGSRAGWVAYLPYLVCYFEPRSSQIDHFSNHPPSVISHAGGRLNFGHLAFSRHHDNCEKEPFVSDLIFNPFLREHTRVSNFFHTVYKLELKTHYSCRQCISSCCPTGQTGLPGSICS